MTTPRTPSEKAKPPTAHWHTLRLTFGPHGRSKIGDASRCPSATELFIYPTRRAPIRSETATRPPEDWMQRHFPDVLNILPQMKRPRTPRSRHLAAKASQLEGQALHPAYD